MATAEGKGAITYLAPPSEGFPRNPSFPLLLNENNFTLLKSGKPGLLQGPRRMLRLCVFAILVPAVLISIPLYVKFVLYTPGHYPMMPTDQRLLNRHVSGIWCQAQSTHMNGSFNTYLSHGFPGVGRERRRHVMLHTMKMRDDVKEYWGFHFLKGSTITISSCARWDGGQLMILRGIENLRRCAWIGEEDSAEDMAEDDDIISEERLKIRDRLLRDKGWGHNTGSQEEDEGEEDNEPSDMSKERRKGIAHLLREAMKMSKDKKEILKILHSEGKNQNYVFRGQLLDKKPDIVENSTNNDTSKTDAMPSEGMVADGESKNQTTAASTVVNMSGMKTDYGSLRASPKEGLRNQTQKAVRKRLREQRRKKKKKGSRRRVENLTEEDVPRDEREVSSRLKRFAEDDDTGGAFEDLSAEDILDSLMDSSKDKEVNISSAEMSIGGKVFYPEGLKFERGRFNQTTMNDNSNEEQRSSYSSSEEALASCDGVIFTLPLVPFRNCHFQSMGLNKITYDIPITGTYYFVFSSDNEIYVNDLFFNLTMDRVVYDTESKERVCANATDCSLPLSFWSDELAVVEVPQEGNWDRAYVLNTKCEPRVYVYLTLLLLAPLFIMFCAFH